MLVGESHLDDLPAHVLVDERPRRACGGDATAVHDDQAVAELLRLVHVVRRHDEGHALLLEAVQALPDEVAGLGVEPGGRLVEDHELGPRDERPGDRQAPPHPARERVDLGAGALGELGELEQAQRPFAHGTPRQVEVAAVDQEVVEDA